MFVPRLLIGLVLGICGLLCLAAETPGQAPVAGGVTKDGPAKEGVPVAFALPTDWPLPRTYRGTLAITDVSDSNWIVRSFLSGEPRTMTAENKGRFTETWGRTAITGISWGGYTTCLVASLDNDFAYPLDSHMKSHADVEHAAKIVRIQVNIPHGQDARRAPGELARGHRA